MYISEYSKHRVVTLCCEAHQSFLSVKFLIPWTSFASSSTKLVVLKSKQHESHPADFQVVMRARGVIKAEEISHRETGVKKGIGKIKKEHE